MKSQAKSFVRPQVFQKKCPIFMKKKENRCGDLGAELFNPVHLAHLVMAQEQAGQEFRTRPCLFNAFLSNHLIVDEKPTIPAEHRKHAGTCDRRQSFLTIGRLKIERGDKSYTYDTVKAFDSK